MPQKIKKTNSAYRVHVHKYLLVTGPVGERDFRDGRNIFHRNF